MKSFEFYSPTKVIFGAGKENEVGKHVREWGGKKVLLHYGGQSARKSGLLDRVEASLKAEGLEYVSLGGVVPNPHLDLVYKGIELCKTEGVDFILAVGGGSVIDSAKAIGVGLTNPGTDVWDFYMRKADPEHCMSIGVILTISAAGSETSCSSVITNQENGFKRSIDIDIIRPRFAIMNPELTYTLPKYQIACGVVDIMMHTLDRYFTSELGNEMTDRFAEAVLKNTIKYGEILFSNPADYKASSEIMWAGSVSHNGLTGLGGAGDFATHQLGHELSARYDVAHGASLSTMWGSWARYVMNTNIERFVQYAVNVWGCYPDGQDPADIALQGIEKTEKYFASLNMPICLSDLKVDNFTDEILDEMAYKSTNYGQRKLGNFLVLDRQRMFDIYKIANH